MKKIFYSHPDIVLAVIAIVFLGMLISFYSWAINDIFLEVHRALVSSPSQNASGFDLEDASKLDFRGLMDGSSTPPTASLPVLLPSVSSTAVATGTVSASSSVSTSSANE